MRLLSSGYLKPLGAACFLALLIMNPSSARDAAAESLSAWLHSVAPSLLPFLIVMPALTCEETCTLLARISDRFLRIFRLPKNASGAILIGLLSGSPSGAAALMNIRRESTDSIGAFTRAAWMASGASSAFLLSGIAVGMLSTPEAGIVLLRSQIASVFLCALLLRGAGSDISSDCIHASPPPRQNAVLSAMLTLLNIGGCMVLFSVLARQLSLLISPSLEMPLLAVMELSGGCQALAALDAPLRLKLPLISAASCFGGISVCAQCMSFLKPLGIHPFEYAAGKIVQAALAALITHFQLEYLPLLPIPEFFAQADWMMLSFLFACCVLLFIMLTRAFPHTSPRSPSAKKTVRSAL